MFNAKKKVALTMANPYENLLLDMIQYRLIPHRSIEGFVQNQFTLHDLAWCYLALAAQMMTWSRLIIPFLHPTFDTNLAVFGFFPGFSNYQLMDLVILLLLCVTMWFQYCLLQFSKTGQNYEGFRILEGMRRKPSTLPSLRFHLLHMGRELRRIRNGISFFFICLSVGDSFRWYWHHTSWPVFALKTILFQPLHVVMTFYTMAVPEVGFLFFYIITVTIREEFRAVEKQFHCCGTSHFAWKCCLRRISRVNAQIWKFSYQTAPLLFVVFYGIQSTMVVQLLLSIDRRTHPLLRTQAILSAGFSFSIVITVIRLFATVPQTAKRLVPLFNSTLGRQPRLMTRLKLQICETRAQVESVGITCANVFTFTTDKLRQMFLNFTLNFILAVNLFEAFVFLQKSES